MGIDYQNGVMFPQHLPDVSYKGDLVKVCGYNNQNKGLINHSDFVNWAKTENICQDAISYYLNEFCDRSPYAGIDDMTEGQLAEHLAELASDEPF